MRERVKVPTITPTKLNNTTRSDQSQPNLRECSMFSQLYGRNIGVHFTIQMPIRAGLFDIAIWTAIYDNVVYRDEALSCC